MAGLEILKGVAYVTGAGSGIGQHTAYSLAKHGVRQLALLDRNPSALQTTVSQLQQTYSSSISLLPIELDVTNEAGVIDSIKQTAKEFGRIDFAVNNAGIGGPNKPAPEVTLQEWQGLMDVNLNSVWVCQREQIKQMLTQEPLSHRQGRGSIVNIASMYGIVAAAQVTAATAYTASKHAVVGLTKCDAIQWAEKGIRINAMCPGYVETPLLKEATASGQMAQEISKVPLRRLAHMEEIGDAVTFLSSPMASYMVGASMIVDGGYTVN